jgi:Flp pilus assembly protein TadB
MAEQDSSEAPRDRKAYLEEQIARQKRGEPIDVDWVKAELGRVRTEQARMMSSMQRNLRLLVVFCAALLLVLWFKKGGLAAPAGVWTLGLILIGSLAAWVLGSRRKR